MLVWVLCKVSYDLYDLHSGALNVEVLKKNRAMIKGITNKKNEN